MIENIRGRSATLSSNANRLDKLEFYMKVIGTITVALILSLSGVALKHIFGWYTDPGGRETGVRFMDIIYRSSSTANAYPLSILSKWLRYQEIVFEPDYVESFCKKGCRNYGHSGGCPPFSPKFDRFADDGKQYLLIVTKYYSKYKTEYINKKTKDMWLYGWTVTSEIYSIYSIRINFAVLYQANTAYLQIYWKIKRHRI